VAGPPDQAVKPPELLRALEPVVEALEVLGVPYYVGGSVASSARGIPRASLDVDVVVQLEPQHITALVEHLQETYYLDETRLREAVAARRSFNLIHLETMLKVDVFVSKGRAFDRLAQDRARPEAIEEGRGIFIASAEDIVLAKLEWFRAGAEVSERQWSDVLGVLRTQGDALDVHYLEQWAADLGVKDLLDRALKEVGLSGS
jgi:hypothetical protein